MTDLTVYGIVDGMCIATWRNVFIDVLSRPPTVASLTAIRPAVDRLFAKHGGQCISISVLEPSSIGPAPPDTKAVMQKLARDYPNLAAATVIEGSGFRMATARMLLTGIFMLQKQPIPHKVFDKISDGARFIASLNPQFKSLDRDIADLLLAVEEARRKIPR